MHTTRMSLGISASPQDIMVCAMFAGLHNPATLHLTRHPEVSISSRVAHVRVPADAKVSFLIAFILPALFWYKAGARNGWVDAPSFAHAHAGRSA